MAVAVDASVNWETIVAEAHDLVTEATSAGITVRVVGSLGVRLHCTRAAAAMDAAGRRAKDVDLVVKGGDRKGFRRLVESRGYEVDRDLLVAMEGTRYGFSHPERGIDLDVFVDKLEFCHTVELDGRWTRHALTLSTEDLLLSKLQVHEMTATDVVDAAVLLATHDVDAADPPEGIDSAYVGGVLAGDWGFHRDATANLGRLRDALAGGGVPLPADGAARAGRNVAALLDAIDRTKKTMAWRMRARVGERMQWWDEVADREETY